MSQVVGVTEIDSALGVFTEHELERKRGKRGKKERKERERERDQVRFDLVGWVLK